jgi:hypothetical protein
MYKRLGTMTRRSRIIILGTTATAVIVAIILYLVLRVPLVITIPASATIALFGMVFALASGLMRVVLLILLLGAGTATLVYFVPGVRSSVVGFMSTVIYPHSTLVGIAILVLAAVASSLLLRVRTDWHTRVILAVTLIPAVVVALLVFVPGVRSAAVASLGAIFGLRGPTLAIAVLVSAIIALFGVILWRWGPEAAQRAGIAVLVVALLYLVPNLLTGSVALISAILTSITAVASAILAWFNGIPGAIATVAAAIIALIGVLIVQIVTVIIQIATIRRAGRDQRHDQASVNERAQDEAIQTYVDWITEELISEQLRDNYPESTERSWAARAKTLWILSRLNKEHKRTVILFLRQSSLIYRSGPVIDLDGADLSNVNMESADLRQVSLRGVDLSGAYLSRADLSRADLSHADLSRTDLAYADLGMGKRETKVGVARRIMRFSAGSRWNGLSRVTPMHIGPRGADLRDADLRDANLLEADLTGADLTGAHRTGEQFSAAKSLEGATMPNGQKYEDWLKDKGSGEDT